MYSTTDTASTVPAGGNSAEPSHKTAGRSDLLELCFPTRKPDGDDVRRLAYANSICLMFIILAIVGIKTPVLRIHTERAETKPIPVVFDPPPIPQTPPVPQNTVEMPDPGSVSAAPMPEVVPVVAASTDAVAFAVPVEGPVILKPVEFASPPPRVLPPPAPKVSAAPQLVEFNAGTEDGGVYPEPDYPRAALQRRMEGRVMLYVEVGIDGSPRLIEIRDSSGYTLLDNHAVGFVKRRWHWPAGTERQYLVPFRFQIGRN